MSEVFPTTSPLAHSFQRCSHLFKELYLALFTYGPISLSKFNDEYGRFGVWGGDSGADRTGRGSLDDVLRNDPKVMSLIAEVLENLHEDLNICIATVKASTSPHKSQSHARQEWLSDEESSVSSGSDAGDYQTSSKASSKTQRILHLLAIIIDHIQSLFQISTILRRPTISDKYLRSTSEITISETESPFYPWDLAHIIEKRRAWITQQKGGLPTELNKAEDIQQQIITYLCKRLATANVKRREQLNFWQTHAAQSSAIKLPNEQLVPKPVPTRPLPKKMFPRSEISKASHETKQSFSTVAKSDLNDSATFSGRPRTEYVSSTKGGKYVLRIPPFPKILDESPTLKCPYCSTTLNGKSMLRRELWKKHVFRDLRPYVCTFEECENPHKLYLTRHDWMYHETQMHRRQWICAPCSHQKYFSRDDMKLHLLAKHARQFPESKLTIIVDICEQPMDDTEDADCPICLATLSLSTLRVHLATHLEELALFVLPCHMEDQSQDVGSDKSRGVTEQCLASSASSSEDGLPPLDFEKISPDASHSQDPKIFSTFLSMEFEQKYMEDWILANAQTELRDDRDSTEAIAPLPEASTYENQSRWDTTEELDVQAAEKRQVQIMETHKKQLGADHPDTLNSMTALASIFFDQGRYDAAEELEKQVMETRKKKLGTDHTDTLTSMVSLAWTYNRQDRYDATEELQIQVMETRKTKLGVDHPDTLTSMTALASTFFRHGQYDAAEELETQVMETRKTKLGADHPDTLTNMANLAIIYRYQGRYDTAEELQIQVMETRKKKLGTDHPDTLTSMADLAWTYKYQDRYDTAKELEVQVEETRKKKLGKDHPDTLSNMENLAITWKENGEETEAIRLMEECDQLRKHVLRPDHPETLRSHEALDEWKSERKDDTSSLQSTEKK